MVTRKLSSLSSVVRLLLCGLMLVMGALPATAGDATVITWNQPTNITYGTPISVPATASNSSGPVAGTFVYDPPLGTVLNQANGNQRIWATFTPASGGRSQRVGKNMRVSAATLTVTSSATKVFGAAMPALTPTYSGFVNGDTAASVLTGSPALSTTATATSAVGSYPITVAQGTLSANNNYALTYVNGTLTVTPASASVTLSNLAHTYNGAGKAATVTTTPAGLATSVTYNGSPTLPVNAGSYTVVATVTNPNYTGSASGTLTIAPGTATVTLGALAHTYDGAGKAATVTTTPAGVATSVTYNGSPTLPVNAGSYAVLATVTDPNYTGSANGTLTIAQATATVTLSDLAHTYDGNGHGATVTTVPAGLGGTITYAGNAALPVNAGSYAVVATVVDPNYTGSANGTLTIAQATATVTLGGLAHTYDGNGKAATVTTVPAGLPVVVSYDSSNVLPVNAGAYEVVASVFDPNHVGSASGTLSIAQAAQTITFATLTDMMVGDPDQPLTASATSGLPVSFTVSGPAQIVAGALHITDAGTVTVTATQAGDGNWDAAAPVAQTITVSPETGGGLLASYFANTALSGAPVLNRIDTQVNFDWADGSPAPGVVPANGFSVRWDGEIVPRFNEAYTLTFRTDDGVRVWFNGQLIVNHWYDRSVANSNYTFSAQAGQPYRIRMEYYENGGQAVAQLRWSSASEPAGPIPKRQLLPTPPDTSGPVGNGTGLGAAYFANETLSGLPTVSRIDAGVNFDWAGGSPASGIPADSFSVRWTGEIQTRYTEPYTLIMRTDDGVRMWLDGQLVMNDWVLRGAANSTYTFNAEAGRRYQIQIEYYEHFGSAVAQLQWYSAREFSGAVPATQLYPLPTPVVDVAAVPQLKAEGEPVTLSGTVSNTGSASMSYAWTQVSGPAAATFQTADQTTTVAHFPVAGTYEVRLSAFNGHVVVSDSAVVTVVAPDLNSGLVAHYTFDETSGEQVIDSSGKHHTGLLYGATRTTGKQGGALRFNGTTFVYVQGNEDLDPTSPALTLAAWLKPDRTLAQMTHPYPMPIYRADYATSTGYALMVTANETERLGLRIHHLAGSGQRMETFTAQALVPNTWVHVAGVYNGSVMSIHLNGVQVASRTVGAINVRAAGELSMFLGRGFEGLMDDVRIYHRALSSSDLASLAQGGLDRRAPGVDAGPDQVASLSAATVALAGSASDDGASGNALAPTWKQVSGPVAASISNANSLTPFVTFSAAGTYEFELAVSDGILIGRDRMRVEVSPSTIDLASGLILHYHLDEVSGTLVADASVHALDATFYGNPVWSDEGQHLGAARFDGQSQIIAPMPNHLGNLTTMTLSVWMRGDRPILDMAHPWPSALYHADFATNRGFALMTTLNDTNNFGFRLHTGTGRREVFMNGVPAGAWVHVVATFDGSTMRLYRDGTLVNFNATGPIPVPAFDARLQIGVGYEGMFDDIRIYDRALSPAEVQSLHTLVPLGSSG